MDPNATMERLREAWVNEDDDEVMAAVEDLFQWMRKGGFLPTLTEPQLSCLLHCAAGRNASQAVSKWLEWEAERDKTGSGLYE